MSKPGRISLGRPSGINLEEVVRFNLRGKDSPRPLLEIEMGLIDFAMFLTGSAGVECTYSERFGEGAE